MSSLYNLEPQPTASCILHTTGGDISLELWAQQVPLTCRNFLQLSLDGYYNNTIFHRLIPGFILQGGDPTGTGSGGESIYDGGAFGAPIEENGIWPMEQRRGRNAGPQGVGFKDEFHSRIKFNRRGLLGMANEGTMDSNGSQFFLTLGETPELQGKNTCFGRVAGETIYNLARMGEAEVQEGSERPLYPIKITSVEVLVNAFKDMVPRKRTAEVVVEEKKAPKVKKRKGGKQLLSFGDEEGDGEEVSAPVVKKTKFDTRIVMDVPEDNEALTQTAQKTKADRPPAKQSTKPTNPDPSPSRSPSPPPPQQTQPKKTTTTKQTPQSQSPYTSRSPSPVEKVTTLLSKTNAEIASLKASMRRTIHTDPVAAKPSKKTALEQMIPSTSIRGRKRGGAQSAKSEQEALTLLRAFQSKLEAAPEEKNTPSKAGLKESPDDRGHEEEGRTNGNAETNNDNNNTTTTTTTTVEDEEATLCDLHFIANCQSCSKWDLNNHRNLTSRSNDPDDDNDTSWMSHALTFAADKLGKDLTYRKKAEEELVVIDPREKARTLKEEKRAEREARSGGSGRAWDQARNEKLSRQAGLAGRGAR